MNKWKKVSQLIRSGFWLRWQHKEGKRETKQGESKKPIVCVLGGRESSIDPIHLPKTRLFNSSHFRCLQFQMDPMGEEQIDYEDDEYGGSQRLQFQGSGAIPALADEELMGEDDEYDDLYNDVNVGEGFMQSLNHRKEMSAPLGGGLENGGIQNQIDDLPGSRVPDTKTPQEVNIPSVAMDSKSSNVGANFSNAEQKRSSFSSAKGFGEGGGNYADGVSQKATVVDMAHGNQVENIGFRGSVPTPPQIGPDPGQMPGKFVGGPSSLPDPGTVGARNGHPMVVNPTGTVANQPIVNDNSSRPILESGPTMLFVGELHWWTTDADLESILSQYGRVKEIKFYDERASGKSKGYCHVEFYDTSAAVACKEGMNGRMFNGRACVVAFASPQTVRQMGAAYMNKNQPQGQPQVPGRRPMNDGVGRGGGSNYQSGDGTRNYGRGGWGRGGGQGFNRGQGGPMRGRGGPMGGRGIVGNTGGVGGGAGGGPYGQGLPNPALGGPAGGLMHPQSMMGAAFDPTYMGRGAAYGGFSGAAFPGMMPSFPTMNTVALPGVAPHVNPAFFGRGVTTNGMMMMGASGMEGHNSGMWADTSMAGWGGSAGDEHGRRTRESSYGGDDVTSDYGYGETGPERGRSNVSREKDRGSERDWSSNSDRRHRDDRELDRDRSDKDRYREEKDGHRDHRQRERDWDNEDDWDRGQSSSRSRSKPRMIQEDDHRSRSRDADYGKRRRLPSE